MKNFIFIFFSFIILSPKAMAGSTTLTTYYPPPVGSYNQLQLNASNNQAASCKQSNSCTQAANNGTVYIDQNDGGNLKVLTVDATNTPTITTFPQQCYNYFCSVNPNSSSGCNPTLITTPATAPSPCAVNFSLHQVDSTHYYDTFQTNNGPSPTTVYSFVCCTT